MKERTLYVTDMDGTLLNNGSFVTEYSSHIISQMTAEGALITVATARTPATVVPLMDDTTTSVPYVVMTGAAMFDRKSMTYINRQIIPNDDCNLLNEIFQNNNVNPFIYNFIDDSKLLVYHHPSMTPQEQDFYDERCNLPLKEFTFQPFSDPNAEKILYFAVGAKEAILKIYDEITATGRFAASCYPDIFAAGIYLLEVFAIGVSKANAILKLKEQLGATRLVAFGDNFNDIPMLEISDLAVAVSNAQPQVKDAADIIIGPNYDNSVADFILSDFHSQP